MTRGAAPTASTGSLELPEPAEGWTATVMGEIAEVVGGGTPDTKVSSHFAPPGLGNPWLTPADLSGFTSIYVNRGGRDLTETGLRNSSARMMPKGSVLLSSRAPIGYVAVATNPISTNQGFKSFVCHDGIVPEYVLFWLRFIRPVLEGMGSGSTFSEISGSRAREIPILVPPLAEQHRIAAAIEALLARVEAARTRLVGVPAILKQFRQAVLAQACSGRLTKDWREGDLTTLHSRSGDNGVPKGWRRLMILDVASKEPRSIQSGPFGSNLHHSEFLERGHLVIGIDNVGDGEFLPGKQHRIGSEKFLQLEKYRARPGDVLVTVMATVGRCCVVPDEIEPSIITKHVYRVTSDPAIMVPRFLLTVLRGDPTVLSQVHDQLRGQTRPGINGEILKSLVVPVPPLEEQREIVRRVDSLLELADGVENRVQAASFTAERVTGAIFGRAFSGNLVPTEAALARAEGRSFESADVLLDRVGQARAESCAAPNERQGPIGRARSSAERSRRRQ
jgi:type I restriction enzyme S subunit